MASVGTFTGTHFVEGKRPKIYHSPCEGTPCPWRCTCGTPSCSQWECPSCQRRCTGSAPDPLWCSAICTGRECPNPRRTGQCRWWWRRSDRSSPARWTSRARWGSWSDRWEEEVQVVRGGGWIISPQCEMAEKIRSCRWEMRSDLIGLKCHDWTSLVCKRHWLTVSPPAAGWSWWRTCRSRTDEGPGDRHQRAPGKVARQAAPAATRSDLHVRRRGN